MQEKRNKQLLITLFVLTSATVALLWLGDEQSTLKIDKDLFRRFDLKTIDQVVLTSPSGKVKLSYNGARWKVNDQYNADRNMIDVLFATLRQAEPKRPVAAALRDSLGNVLAEKGVEVSLLSAGDTVETFLAGGNENKTQAYFKKNTSKEMYVMTIPGYRVYTSGIFELEEEGWRDKYVFGFNWQNFKSLTAQFQDSKHDFTIAMDNRYFGIKDLPQADTAKLNNFLDDVSLLTVDAYLKKEQLPDSVVDKEVTLHLQVEDISGKIYSLQIFSGIGRPVFYGLIDQTQGATFANEKIARILRPKEFFRKQ